MLNIKDVKQEYKDVLRRLTDPDLISDWAKFEELSKKKKKLEDILEKYKVIEEIEKQIEENKSIISGEQGELLTLAESENIVLSEKAKDLKSELEEILEHEKSSIDFDSIIVEIRAGTGGDEAGLFARDLFHIYSKYASSKLWKQKMLNSNPTGLGGYKDVVFEINGKGVYSFFKNEAGVHRVQRIPETEKSGRIHTSTATVAILPKPKPEEIQIKPDEMKIDFFRSSGAGGQNVNKRETAVRVTHLPTGIIVSSQSERNQLQNKENALSMLRAKIMELKREQKASEISSKRKTQIGTAKRVEKIRTYNLPQDRVTDHRLKKSWHGLGKIMSGEIDLIIEAVKAELK